MDTTRAFVGLTCRDCEATVDVDAGTHRCPECGGKLDPTYDESELDLDRETFTDRRMDSMWRYEELLPFPRESAVSIGEGATQLVEAPQLAETVGVGRVLIKDEGGNPTGTVADRGLSVTATAALGHDAETLALASTGNGGQSTSAYAGAAGLPSQVYVPSRTGYTNKAMVTVHGGEMTVVEGRIDDAVGDFEDDLTNAADWYPVQPFQTPYRHEGEKTLFYEIVEQLDWTVPDAIVVPTGDGTELVGSYKGATEFHEMGLIDEVPALYAAQADGCAPIVRAIEEDRPTPEPWQQPDTICGGIEIPDPNAGQWALEAVRETGGGAVSTVDDAILEAAVDVAQSVGVEMSPSAGAAVSGAQELANRGTLGENDTVVLVNTATGNRQSDVLRSHLMKKGI
ncbi:threonine synthase [Halanaeroarchaeum sulfurireducens]|uniref:Threonine synthase n=1 Tax=Halanaeroarchaeum sulfurireducens TaxID=1604004 RepID=A0A0F7P953_9EURY|nr:threonine synthase [Halanaeroarchaeum sulfurireducens]AKH97287.1 threonine synthase [Halanaeroarchaeum sulfurireducens]ALG81689.1 threonine synthase [Halanaeroarchaeum sulfurireducens]